MPAKQRQTQVRLDRKTAEALRSLALTLGYVQRLGPMVGQGSTAQMLEALARGELTIVKRDEQGER